MSTGFKWMPAGEFNNISGSGFVDDFNPDDPEDWNKLQNDEDNGTINWIVLETILECLVIFLSIVGNCFVIISLSLIDQLRRKKCNAIFIGSLASADMLVALLVMPFHVVRNAIGYWPFGATFCTYFIANDVFFCTASILGIICIAIERYIAVYKALRYESIMRTRIAVAMVCATWIISLIVSYIPIKLGWHKSDGIYKLVSPTANETTTEGMMTNNASITDDTVGNGNPDNQLAIVSGSNQCSFAVNPVYAVLSSLISFWLPSVAMVFIYARIYAAALKQKRGPMSRSTSAVTMSMNASNTLLAPQQQQSQATQQQQHDELGIDESSLTDGNNDESISCVNQNEDSQTSTNRTQRKLSLPVMKRNSFRTNSSFTNLRRMNTSRMLRASESSCPSGPQSPTVIPSVIPQFKLSLRTEKTLGRILGCFILCWFPFFTLLVVDSAILSKPLDEKKYSWLFKSVLWLGYANSAGNPFIVSLFQLRHFNWYYCFFFFQMSSMP